jgi:hypothetical protein
MLGQMSGSANGNNPLPEDATGGVVGIINQDPHRKRPNSFLNQIISEEEHSSFQSQ